MNRSKIEWTDYTFNPVTGCTRLCCDSSGKIYCFAYSMARRLKGRCGYPEDDFFRPTIHFRRLVEPEQVKKSAKIFTVSMGDLFDLQVPDVWRLLVFDVIRRNPQHTFQVLTKQVGLAVGYLGRVSACLGHDIPDNLWLGISQDGTTTNDNDIEFFRSTDWIPHKFVSFEPLLGPITANFYGINWIIIGAQTLPGGKTKQPRREWVKDILHEADSWDIPVFLKDNLNWPEKIQEWPEVKT